MARIAVIDTETNWNDEIMSIGVVAASDDGYKPTYYKYFIISPEKEIGGMYGDALRLRNAEMTECTRKQAATQLKSWLNTLGITDLFAYNAVFDCKHLPELQEYNWYDIMKIAAYRQYNPCIPEDAECCRTGRLKRNYGVECILQMLTGDSNYHETHNALIDSMDELRIMRLLGYPANVYHSTKVN